MSSYLVLHTTVLIFGCTASNAGYAALRQILAVDVLIGKAKEMQADSSMRNAPLVEDESVGT